MLRGRYIVLEGDEGAGKTTQIQLLESALQANAIGVAFVQEPGGDALAEELRRILKHALYTVTPRAEVAMFSAARASLFENVIKPLLDDGIWVLSDRSYLSTLVYQGVGRGLDSPSFREAVRYFVEGNEPDLTLVLNVSSEVSAQRLIDRGEALDRFESSGDDFRVRVNTGYLTVALNLGLPIVDGGQPINDVANTIWSYVEPRLWKG